MTRKRESGGVPVSQPVRACARREAIRFYSVQNFKMGGSPGTPGHEEFSIRRGGATDDN